MTGRSEAAEPVSRFLPLTMASALFMDLLDTAALGSALPTMAREFHTEALQLKLVYASAGRSSHFTAAQFILPFVSLGLVTALAVPVYTRLAAQAGAHMRNAGKVSP